MTFRLVPKWVTLNDLERRNGHPKFQVEGVIAGEYFWFVQN